MNTDDIRKIIEGVEVIMRDVDFAKSKWDDSTGEVKYAYYLIYKDNLWKLQRKIGQLWYYVCEQPIVPVEQTIAS
jgi:hypothetical protein